MPNPRVIYSALLLLLLATPGFANDLDSRTPAPRQVLENMSFLVGEWKLTTYFLQRDAEPEMRIARLSARYVMQGTGIAVEEIHIMNSGDGLFMGTAVYTEHPESKQLVGVSNNTLGNRKLLESQEVGDTIVFRQHGELFNDATGYNLHNYTNITEDRYEFSITRCPEGRECIEKTYYYVAERIK